MDNNKKFKQSLFGFSKKTVNDYIIGLSEEFTSKIAALEAKVAEYEDMIKEKDKQIEELEAQQRHVAETLLKSKVEADRIVNTAQSEADTLISGARSEAEGTIEDAKQSATELVNSAKNEAELIVNEARTEAVEIKQINELKSLEEQKEYVTQCINSLKLDVLSAYEVYMLKLEKSMERNDVLSIDEKCIEVENTSDNKEEEDK